MSNEETPQPTPEEVAAREARVNKLFAQIERERLANAELGFDFL